MLEPEFDKAFNLLNFLSVAEGRAREGIERQLDLLSVSAVALDKDGAVLFQNERQRGRDLPEFAVGEADFVDIVHPDGETVRYSAVARRSREGEPEGYFLVGAEVERELAKIPALSDRTRLSELVDKSPVITLMIIPNACMDVIFVSGNIEKLGYSRDRFYSNRLSWLDVVHPEDRSKFVEEVGRLVRISVRFSYRYRILTAGGEVVHTQSDMTVMRDASGKPMYFEGTVTDITDQTELEKAITASTVHYNRRLQSIIDPELDDHTEAQLLEILSPKALSAQFEHMSKEYNLYLMLGDNDSGSIGAWTPPCAETEGGTPLEECAKRMSIPLMHAMKGMLPEKKYQIIKHNEKNIGMTAIYIGSHMAAYCCFCKADGAEPPEGDFKSVCELVNIVCESLSEDCTQNIELMRQVDKTHLLREATDRDYEEQVLVNKLITKLYESASNGEIISDMLSLVGERLGVSRAYLYEPVPDGRLGVTHEWTQGDLLGLPPEARCVNEEDVLPERREDIVFLTDRGNPFFDLCGAVSALHYPIYNGGQLRGVIGVAECINEREWRRDFLSSVFRVVSEAVLWKNSRLNAALMFNSLSSMLENVNALVFVSDYHSQRILFANSKLLKAIERDDGYTDVDRAAQFPDFLGSLLSAGQTPSSGEHFLGGRWYKKTLNPIDWTDGRKALLVCLFDIHDIKEQELRIEYTAYHDPLLGIYNRRRFETDLEQAVSQAEKQPGALILLDLDDFKYINDAYGHDKGDEALKRFVAAVRPILGESVYRYGGDEFMALLRGIEPARLRELVNEIVRTLQAAVSDSEEDLMCTASIGVARYPQDGHVTRDLLRSVDMAMYQAKQEGKGSAFFFTPNMETVSRRHSDLDRLLRREVEEGCPNMSLLYQPMFHTATGELFGAEALLRWNPPGLGVVMPEEFIGMAEMLGLMYEIGNRVLDRAISDAAEMKTRGLDIVVSVNMFMRQLQNTRLADTVLSLLEKRKCPPSSLMLEVTERMTLYDLQRKHSQLASLRKAGVLVCADDFGSGQSSSAHLRERLWNLVKIDCKGIRDIHVDQYMRTFVKTRVRIAHAAGVKVCAEGVENEEQRALLAAFECDFIQGYLMDYPVSAETILEKYTK